MLFNDENELRQWIKNNIKYEELSEEELKKRFIESFGEEKWEEEEALVPIDQLNFKLCDFLGIEPVPILFEEMYEDARYYNELNYIGLSNKYVHDEIECKKSLIHEVRHLYQKHCISHENEKLKLVTKHLINEWKKDFKTNQRLVPENQLMFMSIEVDSFAFTKYILKEWFNYDYHHYDEIYDTLLTLYIDKYFK